MSKMDVLGYIYVNHHTEKTPAASRCLDRLAVRVAGAIVYATGEVSAVTYTDIFTLPPTLSLNVRCIGGLVEIAKKRAEVAAYDDEE